ncbi:acetylxylan esterase [Cohnella herbarum]|uniref:acetylxylan esterase n=1 Tax=Cohnella herbarum TaxID=2728023 RepID=UPI0020C1DACE|nr:acetylxylan esterase [Cohnella herbarum]
MDIAQLFDMSLEEMRHYRPRLTKPDDFDVFWERGLEELDRTPLQVLERVPVEYPSDRVRVFRIAFAGFRGARIEALLALPGVVTYANSLSYLDLHRLSGHGDAAVHRLRRI